MSDEAFTFFGSVFAVPGLWHLCLVTAAVAAILTPLEYAFPAYPQQLVFRRELWVDAAWWFFTPILTRLFTNVVIGLLFFLFAITTGRPLGAELLDGFGPLGSQPLWVQTVELLFLADLIDYWTHRLFHSQRLWPFHAVHHSPEEMSWLSSSRVHPINDLVTRTCQVFPLLLLGFSPRGIILIVPYIAFYVIFLHSNIRWDFGPFRWVLVSPAYHRWHHTTDREAIDRNFAGIFPIWDILFGTAYFPRHLPMRYGVLGARPPETLHGQLAFPFRRAR